MIHFLKKFMLLSLLVAPLAFTGCYSAKDDSATEESQQTTQTSTDPKQDHKQTERKAFSRKITNLAYFKKELRLEKYLSQGFEGQGLSIAILDNGFIGWKAAVSGQSLSSETEFVGVDASNPGNTNHGTGMAQLVHGLAPKAKIYLMHAQGLKNFENRIEDAIRLKVDMILYSQVWEYGGNFDGKGFINKLVNRALDAGIQWVNASGNYAMTSFNTEIQSEDGNFVKLPFSKKYLRFEVTDANPNAKISLSWNDFTDDISYRTAKDLNLNLHSEDGKILARSNWIQNGKNYSEEEDLYIHSGHARELIKTSLAPGIYYISVENISKNFDPSKDSLRISIDCLGARILDAEDQVFQNSVMIPADNPRVISIGSSDALFSSFNWSQDRSRIANPWALAPSLLAYDSQEQYAGSSSAAAAAAASFLVYRSAFGKNSTVDFSNDSSFKNSPHNLRELRTANQFLPAWHHVLKLPTIL